MRKNFKQVMAATLVMALTVPAIVAPDAQAAAKPALSKSSISLKVGKSQKLTIKKVAAKKIKRTKWSVKNSKIAKLSKKKKDSVVVTAKKTGKTTVTAKIKIGSKTYTKSCIVKVTGKAVVTAKPSPTDTPVVESQKPDETIVPSEEPTETTVPTLRPLNDAYKNLDSIPKSDPDSFPDTPAAATVNPDTAVAYSEGFEDVEVGTKTHEMAKEGGIKGFGLRGWDDSEGSKTSEDYLEVVDGSTLPDNLNKTHVLRCFRKSETWQGPMLNISALDGGCSYKLELRAYSDTQDMYISTHLQTLEDSEPVYGNLEEKGQKSIIKKGEWTKKEFTIKIPDEKYFYGLYFESANGQGHGDIYIDDIRLTKISEVQPDKSIPALKDTYKDVFDIVGVGADTDSLLGTNGSEFIAAQFNAFTPGNEMKPTAILGATPIKPLTIEEAKAAGYVIPDNYFDYDDNRLKDANGEFVVPKLDFERIDRIMKECHDKGLKLRGHTLCWHEQTPTYFFQQNFKAVSSKKYNTTPEVMDTRLEFFIKSTLSHLLNSEYADCLYGYDVVNEYLHSKNGQGRDEATFWHTIYKTPDSKVKSGVTLRPSYVKNAFKWADEILQKFNRTDVKLFYNDYNCYQYPEDIVHLIDFINEDGQVCDGLGMQSHLTVTDSFSSVDNYAKALECFRLNMPEMEIQITELDAGGKGKATDDKEQAAYYDELMRAILTNKKNGGKITGLILWGIYDGVSASWRAEDFPCLFRGLFEPKSAFYAVNGAKEKYWK